MSKDNVVELNSPEAILDPLTDMLRAGAQQLIQQAVEAERQGLLAEHVHRRTADGHAGVVRNGHLPMRALQTGIGPVTIKIPRGSASTVSRLKKIWAEGYQQWNKERLDKDH